MHDHAEISQLLQAFQYGYTQRNVAKIDEFMELFTPYAEVIGTNGIKPGVDEWYSSRDAARELVLGDWQSWGDLKVNLDSATIRSSGEVGWIAAVATVTQFFGPEGYANYLEFVRGYLEQNDIPAEQKLHYILRGGTNTVFELHRGEKFVWPLRLTAVVVRDEQGWKFAQVNFSFPTIYYPDVRLFD